MKIVDSATIIRFIFADNVVIQRLSAKVFYTAAGVKTVGFLAIGNGQARDGDRSAGAYREYPAGISAADGQASCTGSDYGQILIKIKFCPSQGDRAANIEFYRVFWGGGLNRIPQGAIPFAAAVIVFINQGVHSDYGDCGRLSCLYLLAAQEQYRDQQDSK